MQNNYHYTCSYTYCPSIVLCAVFNYLSYHLPWGVPQGSDDSDTCILTHSYYINKYSTFYHIPLWVAYKLNGTVSKSFIHSYVYIHAIYKLLCVSPLEIRTWYFKCICLWVKGLLMSVCSRDLLMIILTSYVCMQLILTI